MTKYWGPLGWTTLHTVSALYPDNPTSAEIELAKNWIQQFADCITCPSCQGHFKTMLALYQSRNPAMVSSRREFCLFVIRAHNTVNRRLGKKIYTYDDVWTAVAQWDNSKAKSKRYEYLMYLRRDWGSQNTNYRDQIHGDLKKRMAKAYPFSDSSISQCSGLGGFSFAIYDSDHVLQI
jgi:FAD-linked sulfhydryl oxidase